MVNTKFTLLIGSFARGTGDLNSDIDVLRIGHTMPVIKPASINPRLPLSYVDYDLNSFFKLYDAGSLFLYHAFFEGRLLDGDSDQWNKLGENFVVSDSFITPINEYIEVLEYIDSYPGYELSFVPYLSNIFKCLKNIGIFQLASRKQYNFEKMVALEAGCGLTSTDARTLILANAVYERSMPISPQLMTEFKKSANKWNRRLNGQIARLANDI